MDKTEPDGILNSLSETDDMLVLNSRLFQAILSTSQALKLFSLNELDNL